MFSSHRMVITPRGGTSLESQDLIRNKSTSVITSVGPGDPDGEAQELRRFYICLVASASSRASSRNMISCST